MFLKLKAFFPFYANGNLNHRNLFGNMRIFLKMSSRNDVVEYGIQAKKAHSTVRRIINNPINQQNNAVLLDQIHVDVFNHLNNQFPNMIGLKYRHH